MTTQATAIRDAIYDRLSVLAAYKTVRKTPVPQEQPANLPSLSIFITGERLTPDGDDNAGEPRFDSETTIAVSVVRGFDDNRVLEGYVDQDVDEIEATLLTDPVFVGFGSELFEAVTGITRRRLYPQSGETYFSELRLEMTFRTRVSYPPVIPDDFNTLAITTRPLGHPNAPGIEQILDQT